MSNLTQDLEMLRKLNESRRYAKELRGQAAQALRKIKRKDKPTIKRKNKSAPEVRKFPYKAKGGGIDFERWVAADDNVEIALLVKVQSDREIGENESENNNPVNPSPTLKSVLTNLTLKKLLPQPDLAENNPSFPVLLAARAMQALVSRAETVFEPATMYCYYRIIRELYGVAQPNWTVGAARAGIGGTTSAFVTNECVRAILAFERALGRTYTFFRETCAFYEYVSSLQDILKGWCIKKGPLFEWANKSLEAMWLDCQLATNPRNREMALFSGRRGGENALLLPDRPDRNRSHIKNAILYFDGLPAKLVEVAEKLLRNLVKVSIQIEQLHKDETPKKRPSKKESKRKTRAREEAVAKFNRTETAHLFAKKTITNAIDNALDLLETLKEAGRKTKSTRRRRTRPRDRNRNDIDTKWLLKEMAQKFYTIRRRVHHVLEPSKQYLKLVLNRELAAPPATFDAGELVFAATSYGAIHDWRLDDKLTRACEKLVSSLPDGGRLPTKRPFHADRRGYRTIPIGCEMTRSLATLLQKTGYVFDANFVPRMLSIFEENVAELVESTAENKLIGWNFDGAPDPDKPSVWVTAVSVLALDRIVRMLNTRINEIVLAHFDVTKPERPHTRLTLRDLIYSDYGLVKKEFHKDEEKFMAIHLQKARAHVMRATLPTRYREDNKNFSTIYYGPPQTGKTTLAEALALSARVPLLRLSPGDLILQGQELIEGRAHDVFEALSMLTQCVIIFDEFEPVLKNRGNDTGSTQNQRLDFSAKQGADSAELSSTCNSLYKAIQNKVSCDKDALHNFGKKDELTPLGEALENISQKIAEMSELKRIGDILSCISEKEDPKFRFVLGGMLPRLIKLHDAAEKQSFAYCLATNRLAEIDPAAKRKGRFDKRLPVYKPDALSRTGILLYRLSQTRKIKKAAKSIKNDKKEREKEIISEVQHVTEIVGKTIGQPADRISRVVKIINSESRELKTAEKSYDDLLRETPLGSGLDKEENEEAQRVWIHRYEKRFLENAKDRFTKTTRTKCVEHLNKRLSFEGNGAEEAAK
jgi:SpoVK/Ycf46/Vps4 family AAA+-type ATPase